MMAASMNGQPSLLVLPDGSMMMSSSSGASSRSTSPLLMQASLEPSTSNISSPILTAAASASNSSTSIPTSVTCFENNGPLPQTNHPYGGTISTDPSVGASTLQLLSHLQSHHQQPSYHSSAQQALISTQAMPHVLPRPPVPMNMSDFPSTGSAASGGSQHPLLLEENQDVGAVQVLQALRSVSPSDRSREIPSPTTQRRTTTTSSAPAGTGGALQSHGFGLVAAQEPTSLIHQLFPSDVILDAGCTTLDHSQRSCHSSGMLSMPDNKNYTWRHNTVFAELVAAHAQAFATANLSSKSVIVEAIATSIHRNNGRFLERHPSGNGDSTCWRQVRGHTLVLGVAQALWEHLQQLRAEEATATSSSNTALPTSASTLSDTEPSMLLAVMDRSELGQQHPSTTANKPMTGNLPQASMTSFGTNASVQVHGEGDFSKQSLKPSTGPSSDHPQDLNSVSARGARKLPLKSMVRGQVSTKSPMGLVKKKANPVKKSSTKTAHNPDGTFAHKRPASFTVSEKKGIPGARQSQGKRLSKLASKTKEQAAANFDPQTWLAENGTTEAFTAKAQEIVPRLSVKGIPRGVTVRPSGKWQAQFYFEGQSRYISVFESSHEAAMTYECVHRLLAGFRELSRLYKPCKDVLSCVAEGSTNRPRGFLTKEEIRTLFDSAREAAVLTVSQHMSKQQRDEECN